MSQIRNKKGSEFEKLVCEQKGWVHSDSRPKINWVGFGLSNWKKMEQIGLDYEKFMPNIEKSKFSKYDAINENGEKIEIKKYTSKELSSWTMYSEPIFKIANKNTLKTVIPLFGDGDPISAVTNYNKFLRGVIHNIGSDVIINRITQSNIGVQLKDIFIPQENLEYRWKMVNGWRGYNRYIIEFKIK